MKMYLLWYDRNEDFSADYNAPHAMTLEGSADETMAQFNAIRANHDLVKYTRMEINRISA